MSARIAAHSASPKPLPSGGFSLIELVVAMLVAAILAAIAVPAYSSYVRKSRRVEAKTALLDITSLEERYYSANNTYSTSLADVGYGASAASAVTVGNGYYSVSAPVQTAAAVAPTATTAGSPMAYSVTATAVGDQLKDTQCRSFTVLSNGTSSSLDASSTDTTATCWK